MEIEVKVIPNAKKREILYEEGRLRVKLTAPPLDGRANEELVACLAEAFKVRKSEVRILRGERGRKKVLSLPVEVSALERFQGV
jgi:uncharacterized protein (TIGR00251 family)